VIPYNPHRAYAESRIVRETAGKIHRELKEYLANNYREHYAEKIENGVAFEIVTKSGREDDEIIKFAEQEKVDLIVRVVTGEPEYSMSFSEVLLKRSSGIAQFPFL
jgi:nucleotide-binding universal stress UspA family protein